MRESRAHESTIATRERENVEKTTRTKGPRRKQVEEHGFSMDELQQWKAQVEKAVRDHPILSAGIAVGAGVLIARLIKDAVGDEPPRKSRGGRIRGLMNSEIGRALMGSAATMVAAKIQEAMVQHAVEEVEAESEPAPRRRRRPSKQGRPATKRRRRPVEE